MLAQNVDVAPLTPCGITCHEELVLPVHVTPDLQETSRSSEAGPKTPHKENTVKKKTGKAGSKRKLFLQTPGLNISKAKKQGTRAKKSPSSTTSVTTAWLPGETAWPNFPQTERQQLQYLLEVTAKDAQNISDSGPKESMCASNLTKVRRKDAGKENSITARIFRRNERGETALHVAAIKGDLDDLVALIDAGVDVNARDNAGWSPLHEACNYGHQEIVEKLVEAGADINVPGYEAITPVHDAVINDHVKVVQFLLLHGADPLQTTNQGYTAVDLANSSAVRDSLRQFEILHCPTAKGNVMRHAEEDPKKTDSKTTTVEQKEVESEIKIASDQSLSHNKRQFLEYFKDCKTGGMSNKDHLSPNLTRKPVSRLQVRERTPANGFENDVTVQSLVPTDIQKFAEGVRAFDTDATADERAAASLVRNYSLFTSTPTNYPGHTNSFNEYLDKEFVQTTSHSEEDENTSNAGRITGRTDDSCSVLLAGKTGVASPTKGRVSQHSDGPCENLLSESNETSGYAVQSDPPLFAAQNRNSCTHKNPQRQESAGSESVVSEEREETRECYLSEAQESGVTKTTHRDVGMRTLQSETEMCVGGMRSIQKRKSTRSSRSSKSKTSTSSSTSDAAPESMPCEARVAVKGYDQVQERAAELGMCLNHTASKTWRAAIDKQRYKASLIPVCVPGYEEFLMYTKSYSLSGSVTATQHGSSACKDPVVLSRDNKVKKMKIRQQIEKEKLRLALEQELVRVFGNFARKSAGYDSPYGACAIIQAQMISNHSEAIHSHNLCATHSLRPEVETILNKFEKLKRGTYRRHRHEVDALLSLSQLEGLGDANVFPEGVTSGTATCEDFELVPRKFREYYENVLCFSE